MKLATAKEFRKLVDISYMQLLKQIMAEAVVWCLGCRFLH
jgi:hypothetical protein